MREAQSVERNPRTPVGICCSMVGYAFG